MVIRIGEDRGRTALLVDGVVQSISPEDGLKVGGYWAAMVPPDLRPSEALILGMGGGTLARLLLTRWGAVRIVGVDDNEMVLSIATAVGWLPTEGVEIVVDDAFSYVQSCDRTFDYVGVDLFRGERLAKRVFSKPFLRAIRALLEPRGQLAINMFDDSHEPDRTARIASLFELRQRLVVGGNVVLHARSRRRDRRP